MRIAHEHALRAASQPLAYAYWESPVGRLLFAGDERGLWLLAFARSGSEHRLGHAWRESREPFQEMTRQLDAYFHRELRQFDLPLHLEGTEFQLAVWNALRLIPYGSTASYGELARGIGRPGAVRAVGAANALNPIAIVIPCHRVIGSNGKLVGYGGGLAIKDRLLALERRELF